MSNMAIQHNYYHGDLLILGNVMVYAEERLPTWKLKYLANASTREFSDVVNLIRESWNYNFPNPREREIAYLEKMAAMLKDLTGQMTPSYFSLESPAACYQVKDVTLSLNSLTSR
jgi:hypothetical protein